MQVAVNIYRYPILYPVRMELGIFLAHQVIVGRVYFLKKNRYLSVIIRLINFNYMSSF